MQKQSSQNFIVGAAGKINQTLSRRCNIISDIISIDFTYWQILAFGLANWLFVLLLVLTLPTQIACVFCSYLTGYTLTEGRRIINNLDKIHE